MINRYCTKRKNVILWAANSTGECMENFTAEILRRLKAGQRVSALQATKWLGNASTKTTSRISDLRKRGYDIKADWRKTPQGKRYLSYYMGARK